MRRVLVSKPGGYDRLQIVEGALAELGPDDVHVAVRAIGVNYADCVVRMGLYESAKKYVGWPITPGFEFAGSVAAVGNAVSDLALGERVFGITLFGAYQTDVVVPRRNLFVVPEALDFEQAGSFPVPFLTAWFALRELCRLRRGARILIHSAAGGVGGAAIRIGKALGAEVVGVVGRADKREAARSFGADLVVDKSSECWWQAVRAQYPEGVDVVLDPNGPETLRQSYALLGPMGRLVIYGFQSMLPKSVGRPNWFKLLWSYLCTPKFDPLRMTNDNKSVLAFNLSYLSGHQDRLQEAMMELLSWLDEGRIAPLPVRTFPFERVADAHRALESGQTTGRLALTLERSPSDSV
jgi:NADPH:quinone reductase-like Zn-dependent oxidoreductase